MPRSISLLFVTRGGIVGLNFLALLAIAALMQPSDFGRFVFLWSAAQFVAAVAGVGGVNYLMREGSARQGDAEKGVRPVEAAQIAVLWPAALLIAIGLAFAGISLIWANLFEAPLISSAEMVSVCCAAGALILLSHSATPLRLNELQTASMVVRDAMPQSLLLVVVVACFVIDSVTPVRTLVIFSAIAAVIAVLALLIGLRLSAPLWRAGGGTRGAGQTGFWGSSIVGVAVAQFDILLGGLFVSDVQLGQYQIAKKLANLIGLPQIVANWSAIVRLGKQFAAGEMKALQATCDEAVKWSFLPGLVLALGSLLVLPFFFQFYEIDNSAQNWTVFLLLAASNLVNLAFGVNLILAAQSYRETLALAGRIAGVAIGSLLIVLLAGPADIVGLAIAVLAGMFITNAFVAFRLHRELGINTTFLRLLRKEAS